MVGPSWVIFTVMGAREFAVHGHGIDAAGGAMLGMSILLGGRGLGALVGPLVSARWAGESDHRLRLGILFGYLTIAGGYGVLGASRSVWMAAACAMLAPCGRLDGMGLLDDAAATSYRRPLSRARVCRRPWPGQPDVCRDRVSGWPISGCRNLRANGRHRYGRADADSGCDPGLGAVRPVAYREGPRGFRDCPTRRFPLHFAECASEPCPAGSSQSLTCAMQSFDFQVVAELVRSTRFCHLCGCGPLAQSQLVRRNSLGARQALGRGKPVAYRNPLADP